MFNAGQKSIMENIAPMPYSKQVLVGNWFDRRNSLDGQSNAILPGLRCQDGCEHHRTLNQDTYTDVAFTGMEAKHYFEEKRMLAFENHQKGSNASAHFIDDEALNQNYTTLNTLIFGDLLKHSQQLDRCNIVANVTPKRTVKRKREIDFMQCFGNQAKTLNIAKTMRRQEKLDQFHLMQTTYSTSYNRARKSNTVFEFGPDYDGVVKFDLVC